MLKVNIYVKQASEQWRLVFFEKKKKKKEEEETTVEKEVELVAARSYRINLTASCAV